MSSYDQFNLSFSKMTTFNPQLARQQSGGQGLKPHAQAHLLSPTDKCKICAEPAARHVHYGATTCFSCRAFFRRSLQNKTAAKYNCMKHSMCEMNIKTRKNCQYCRYMKCLAIGMNPNYVLSEDERKRRFNKRKISITEEPAGEELLILDAPFVTAPTVEERLKNKEIVKTESIPKPILRNLNETALFKKPYQRHTASSNNGDPRGNTIPPLDCQTGRTQVRKFIPLQKNYFEQMHETRRGSPSCHPLLPDKTQIRSSIIKKIGHSFYNTSVGSQNTEFIANDKNASFSKQPQHETFKDEELHNVNEEINSHITFNALSSNSSKQNEKFKFKETNNEAYDIYTSSESEDDMLPQIRMNSEPEIIFSEDEKNQLDKLVKEHDMVYHSVNFGEVLIKEMLMCSMFGVAVSTSAAITGYRLQVERITRIANTLKCFTSLHKVDQVALLKENVDLLVSLRGAIFFNKKKKEDMDTIEKTFKPMIQNHYMNHIDYNVFNSIQEPGNQKTEERYSFLQGKVSDSNYYLGILHRCIYSANSRYRACNNMANTLNAVTCVREMADIKKNRTINSKVINPTNSAHIKS